MKYFEHTFCSRLYYHKIKTKNMDRTSKSIAIDLKVKGKSMEKPESFQSVVLEQLNIHKQTTTK